MYGMAIELKAYVCPSLDLAKITLCPNLELPKILELPYLEQGLISQLVVQMAQLSSTDR